MSVEVSARGPHSPIVFGRVGARAESFWQLLPAAGSSCSGGSSPGPFFFYLVDGGTYYPSN